MTDAPERIWAFYSNIFGVVCLTGVKDEGADEYIRADLAKAQAEALLSDPRVQALVEAGNKMADGIEYGMLGLSDAVKQWDAALRAIEGE